ncbi:MAG: hypothetical protein Kow0031_03030 [Anaerolineae bacterium]
MTGLKAHLAATFTVLTVTVIFSLSGSWSGVERAFGQPGLQILKSEVMSILVTTDSPKPAVAPAAITRFSS